MSKSRKLYYSCSEVQELLGVSQSYAYKLIRKLNKELAAQNYLTISGKIPCAYFDEKWYGHGA